MNGLNIGQCVDQWANGRPCNIYECNDECQQHKGPHAGGMCDSEHILCLCIYDC